MPDYESSDSFLGQDLSQEAVAIAREAEAPLRQWIKESVEDLKKEFDGKVAAAAAAFESETKEMASDYEKIGTELTKLVAELNKIKTNLPPGTNPDLLTASKEAADGVKSYLEKREQQWKGAGAAAVKALWTAKTAVTGIP